MKAKQLFFYYAALYPIIIYVVREIEYACYKSEYGEWACKNGAPKYLEQTSIPDK